MIKLLFTVCLLSISFQSYARHQITSAFSRREQSIRSIGKDTCLMFSSLLDELYLNEQKIRSIGLNAEFIQKHPNVLVRALLTKKADTAAYHKIFKPIADSKETLDKIDSIDHITFMRLKKFCNKYGLIQINELNYPNTEEYQRCKHRFFIICMHLSDVYGLDMMALYEASIINGTINEHDLIDYVLVYLQRKTQIGNPDTYFIVPLRNLFNNRFSDCYEYAVTSYLKYKNSKNPDFEFGIFPDYFKLPSNEFKSRSIKYYKYFKLRYNLVYTLNYSKLYFLLQSHQQQVAFIHNLFINKGFSNYLVCNYSPFTGYLPI